MENNNKILDNKYFNRKYVETITGSKAKANTLINQYLKEGSIIRARHNLYVTIDKTLDILGINIDELLKINNLSELINRVDELEKRNAELQEQLQLQEPSQPNLANIEKKLIKILIILI